MILDLIYSATSSVLLYCAGTTALSLPHDPLAVASSFYPIMHILTVARAMENAKRNQTEYPERTVSRRASVGFAMTGLSVVFVTLVVLFKQDAYPFHPHSTCSPCDCDLEHTLHSCQELKVLHLPRLDLHDRGIERIRENAFKELDGLTALNLDKNRIKTIETGAFRGLSLIHI